MVLPPLPAFVTPTPAPAVTPTKPVRAGFFRRVFGGGSSAAKQTPIPPVDANKDKVIQPIQPAEPVTGPPPNSTINKKASFFRRRKKSISEAIHPPPLPPPLPLPIARDEPTVDAPEPSPASGRINPYLRTPVVSTTLDIDIDRESRYLQRDATIRTVAATEVGSPHRLTFFGETNVHHESEPHFAYSSSPNHPKTKVYSKEPRLTKAPSELTITAGPKKGVREDRPQNSPNSSPPDVAVPTEEFKDLAWPPPLGARRSFDNIGRELEKGALPKPGTGNIGTTKRQVTPVRQDSETGHGTSVVNNNRDMETHHPQPEQKRRNVNPLCVDVNVDGFRESSKNGSSWLATATPGSAGCQSIAPTVMSTAPTVMLQVEVDGDTESGIVDLDNLNGSDEATEHEKNMAQKIFDGDEEYITKARAAAWLGAT